MKLKEVLQKVNKEAVISIYIVGELVKKEKNKLENFEKFLDFVVVETKPLMCENHNKNIEKLHINILPF